MYYKNIYKTLMRLEQLERNRANVKKLQALTLSILEMNSETELVALLYMHEHLFISLVTIQLLF